MQGTRVYPGLGVPGTRVYWYSRVLGVPASRACPGTRGSEVRWFGGPPNPFLAPIWGARPPPNPPGWGGTSPQNRGQKGVRRTTEPPNLRTRFFEGLEALNKMSWMLSAGFRPGRPSWGYPQRFRASRCQWAQLSRGMRALARVLDVARRIPARESSWGYPQRCRASRCQWAQLARGSGEELFGEAEKLTQTV
jgi:hypothetical protein